jgi:hypothetical protein
VSHYIGSGTYESEQEIERQLGEGDLAAGALQSLPSDVEAQVSPKKVALRISPVARSGARYDA